MKDERHIQFSPSAMLHHKGAKSKKSARALSQKQFSPTNSQKGFGYLGSQSFGGRGK
ncbi:MAG: hypothetical protein KGL39_41420 [Patescibacteria group bacterium]|nr:hypothetical protein [Patescibacteria group bacterium]